MPLDTTLRCRWAQHFHRVSRLRIGYIAVAILAALPARAIAQDTANDVVRIRPVAKSDPAMPRMDRLSGVWVDGPGYDIVYGGNYDACATRCLAASACAMIEYYRPEKKCNMYKSVRPHLKGGSSDVAVKR
jgi:hypothetical protein